MNSTLPFLVVVIIVLATLLAWFKLKDVNILKSLVYDIVSLRRNGSPSMDEIKNILMESSYTPPFSDMTLAFVLYKLEHEHKITTSTLRVTYDKEVTYITTYVPCSGNRKSTVRKNLHCS